jgi:tetratricopeptide (TPR) repeat protein
MTLSAGDRLGRYEILGPLGAGGMGEVYRAKDTELDRDVAIKVLPEAVAQNPDRLARFETEAKAVAKLSHPNILDIHDYGREGDSTYSVTELLEGETLRERLEGGALGWRKATEIGASIADGLAAAHQAGIVHRDLKPSNVFLTADGRVKVLDFGLARYEPEAGGQGETAVPTMTRQTDPGTTMGTVGYMSPEQVRGETVDQRSDIFSLGCVLYELVTGTRAFTSDTAAETMTAILREEPTDISASGVMLPQELAGTIRRCLEKRPESRFQSASDLAYNLRTISSASTPSATGPVPDTQERKRPVLWIAFAAVAVVAILAGIAVWAPWREAPQPTPQLAENRVAILPLENRTGDPSLDTLGAMAADLIVQRFTETGAAEVVPMDEATVVSALENAQEQGAALVVSGAYYLEGERLSFQARLSDVATSDLIYAFEPVSASRDAATEGIDALRERIVAAAAMHLTPNFDVSVMRPPSTHEAFQIALRGVEIYSSDYARAAAHFQQVIEIDPDFHMARLWAGDALTNAGDREGAAREFSVLDERIDRLTPLEQAYLQYTRGFLDRDLAASMTAARRALQLAPQITIHRLFVALFALPLNRPQEAIEALDPAVLSALPSHYFEAWWPLGAMAIAQHLVGDYEKELEYAELGIERFPDVGNFYRHKAGALAALGQAEAVQTVIEDCTQLKLREPGLTAGLVMAWVALELRAHGHHQQSLDLAGQAVEWYDRRAARLGAGSIEPGMLFVHSWVLRVAGRWEEAAEPLLERKELGSYTIDVAGSLGLIAARTGDHEEARRIFDDMPDSDRPGSAADRAYWRAAIAANLGEEGRAVELLRESYSLGRRHDIEDHVDVDVEPLWDHPEFQELIRPKG